MKLSYKQRIFFYFFLIFTAFTIVLIVLEQQEQKVRRTEALEDVLSKYVDLTNKYIKLYNLTDSTFEQLHDLDIYLLDDVRITIINPDGDVLYDKDITDKSTAENHLDRPEIQNALHQNYGTNIRRSSSTNQEYIYYAKHYPDYYIRVALPYSIETKSLLKANHYFMYIVILLFIVVLIMLNYVASRFGKSISQLKDFVIKVKNDRDLPQNIHFPDDELGEIGKDLVEIFNQKTKSKQEIETEREKLIQHFQYSEKGLCIFTAELKKIYANTHFIYYMNLILDNPVFEVSTIFEHKTFSPVTEFLYDKNRKQNLLNYQLNESGKIYTIQVVVFDDKSFEITIQDVTRTEKNRLLKQQMTSNIAHELRTPVTSLRAYLETLNEQKLTTEKQSQFTERAYQQSMRLSELIEDISLISKIEEAPSQFSLENVNLFDLTHAVKSELEDKLTSRNIKLNISMEEDIIVNGNQTLLYSVFRNMVDNSIKYGGENIEIHINNYLEDSNFYYFSYYDNGKGVSEEHLNRLFERFYRIESGRTRDTGGSGLGLSIVKNAVLFHKGKIQAKIHSTGGLQFLFTLKK